jgi:hypothetical protein
MSETKTRVLDFPLDDDLLADHLPEPVALTPEQIAARNALIEQDRLRRADWDAINKALRDDAMSVTRGIGKMVPARRRPGAPHRTRPEPLCVRIVPRINRRLDCSGKKTRRFAYVI